MWLWWQQEWAKLRMLPGDTAEEHAVLLAILGMLIVPLVLAFVLAFIGVAPPGIT